MAPLTVEDKVAAESAVDYVIVGQLSEKEAAEAAAIAKQQEIERANAAHRSAADRASATPPSNERSIGSSRRGVPAGTVRKTRRKRKLTDDDVIRAALEEFMARYPVDIRRVKEIKPYGAPIAATEK